MSAVLDETLDVRKAPAELDRWQAETQTAFADLERLRAGLAGEIVKVQAEAEKFARDAHRLEAWRLVAPSMAAGAALFAAGAVFAEPMEG